MGLLIFKKGKTGTGRNGGGEQTKTQQDFQSSPVKEFPVDQHKPKCSYEGSYLRPIPLSSLNTLRLGLFISFKILSSKPIFGK